jgi:GT2 family glycosyltransferase
LSALWKQDLPQGCDVEICVVDDNSSDGTYEAISAQFPKTKVLTGSGELFWAGAMRLGWQGYVQNRNPDYLLVYNDDIMPLRRTVSNG